MTQTADTRTPPYGSAMLPDEHATLPQDTGPQQRYVEEERVYELVEVQGMRQVDVAPVLSLSTATVSRRLQAARERRAAREARDEQNKSLMLTAVRVVLMACAVFSTIALWVIAIRVALFHPA